MEAPLPIPPRGLNYNAYRTWRSSNLGKSSREELSRGWEEYKQSRSSPNPSPSRVRSSPNRPGQHTSPKLSPTTRLRQSRVGVLAGEGISGMPADLLRRVLAIARKEGTGMGDILRFCSTSNRMATFCRDDGLWRLIFEARHGVIDEGIPKKVTAKSEAYDIHLYEQLPNPGGGDLGFLDLNRPLGIRHMEEKVIAISGSLRSVQYGTVPLPSWKVWLRLVEAELPHRDVPVSIRLVPTNKEIYIPKVIRDSRLAQGDKRTKYSADEVLELQSREFETRIVRNRATRPQDSTFLATPATYFSLPTPASMRRFREEVAKYHHSSTPGFANQRLLEAGLLLDSIVRSPTNPGVYTATLRIRVIPELGEDLHRVLKHFRITGSLKNPTTFQGVYGRVSIEYPATLR